MRQTYEYDVAFSFLSIDESIAAELHSKLKGRLSSFFYADEERQRSIAGQDGDAVYGAVFGTQARTVVILHRAEWGKSGFTLIEATAIRNRAYEHGYDFVTFINRDGSALPSWVPKTRVWIGLDKLGVDAAAAVIESRVQGAGGEPQDETADDRAGRMLAELKVESERRVFLHSADGAKAALDGCSAIFMELERIGKSSGSLIAPPKRIRGPFRFERLQGPSFTFELPAIFGWVVTVAWNPLVRNTTKNAELVVREWRGAGPEPKRSTSFVFDYSNSRVGWREKGNEGQFYGHGELADWIAKRLLARIEEVSRNGR